MAGKKRWPAEASESASHKGQNTADELRAQIRKEVAEDGRRAASTWKEADAALSKALKAPEREKPVDSKASLPLLRASSQRRLLDDWSSGSDSDYTGSVGNPTGTGTAGDTDAFGRRAKFMRVRAAETQRRLGNHGKRRLRAKIATILQEVRKRQELHRQQERSRKFMEQRCAERRGPHADLGHATGAALDLSRLNAVKEQQVATSPRRTSLLNALDLSELEMIRRSPHFFFTGSAIWAAVGCPELADCEKDVSSPRKERDFNTDKSLREVRAALNQLVSFFQCKHRDKDLDCHQYERKLHSRLVGEAEAEESARKLVAESATLRQKMCRSQHPAEEPATEGFPDGESPPEPLELMPCLGRHPPVSKEEVSPTLQRVRQVYNRRDEADARWVEEKREAIDRRLDQNAFKAREQQREIQLRVNRQKEMFKIRQLETEVRKSMLDAEEFERAELRGVQKNFQVSHARALAERVIEEKRDKASAVLDTWQQGTIRSRMRSQQLEAKRKAEARRQHQHYMSRLQSIGERRHNVGLNQSQKNDKLKENIHASLFKQLKAEQEEENQRRSAAIDAKLEAAAERRKQSLLGGRYDLTKRALGAEAVGFDLKYHTVSVDRRDKPWRTSAKEWNLEQHSYSLPDLQPASRLWTAEGSTSEQEFVERTERLEFSLA